MRPTPKTLAFLARNDDALLASWRVWFGAVILSSFIVMAGGTGGARADESGVSFWVPGFFGSLAATPQQPGWSLATIYYRTDVSASGGAAVAREITIGRFNPTVNVNVNANVHAVADLGFVIPTYVFATPFLGGQASASVLLGYGSNDVSLNAKATASTDQPAFSVTRSLGLQQDTLGFADIIPMFANRWNAGVNNYMAYITGDIPVGLRLEQSGEYRPWSWRDRRRRRLHLFRPEGRPRIFGSCWIDREFRESLDELHQRP